MTFDLERVKQEVRMEAVGSDNTGIDMNELHVSIADIYDDEALGDIEKFIKTGRRVHLMELRDFVIPHIVIVSSPRK